MTIHPEHLGDYLTILLYLVGGIVGCMIVMMAIAGRGLIGCACRTVLVAAALGLFAVSTGFISLQ